MISESLRTVWAVETMGHPSQKFVIFYESIRAIWAVEPFRHPLQQFVDDF